MKKAGRLAKTDMEERNYTFGLEEKYNSTSV